MKYRFIENLTSDVMFEAYGKTFEVLLENSAMAMFSVICNIKNIKPLQEINIELSADSEEELLHRWLSKLLTHSEINNMFLCKFKVGIKENREKNKYIQLFATIQGEPISPKKSGTVVKGIPYYGFKLEHTAKGYIAKVVLDI